MTESLGIQKYNRYRPKATDAEAKRALRRLLSKPPDAFKRGHHNRARARRA